MEIATISREQYRDHLLSLNKADRQLRFLSPYSDESIRLYVDSIDNLDIIFGYSQDNIVQSAIHASFGQYSEFGISTLEPYRGNKLGSQLVEYLFYLCRQMGIKSINCVCARDNKWMIKITKRHEMNLTYEYTECNAAYNFKELT